MMQFRPITSIPKLNGRPINSVEIDIVFTHELEKANVLGVKPPLFPFGGIVGCNAWITYWGIELKFL
jgi:hypothetical protein